MSRRLADPPCCCWSCRPLPLPPPAAPLLSVYAAHCSRPPRLRSMPPCSWSRELHSCLTQYMNGSRAEKKTLSQFGLWQEGQEFSPDCMLRWPAQQKQHVQLYNCCRRTPGGPLALVAAPASPAGAMPSPASELPPVPPGTELTAPKDEHQQLQLCYETP